MLISYNWLKEYLPDLPEKISPQKLSEELTLLGLEVTEVKSVNPAITGLRVGEVMEKWKHPNADRLNLTKIRYLEGGKEVLAQVVCGASNIAAGQKIILATVGTELSPGFLIQKAKIRGEESCGMVCSREELGKEEKSEGIWVIPDETTLDTDPQDILGRPDYLLDFDISSNRWDAMSTLGVAREVGILLNTQVTHQDRGSFAAHEPTMETVDFSQLPLSSRVKVTIEDPADCYRYQGLDITGIQVAPSPGWLSERLFQHDLRPIENVVDVTNLILKEYGQPIHAFDTDKIGTEITVRRARNGESLTLLDGKKIKLLTEDLVIADENGPIALAGVMGGAETGVTATTKNVFLETAVFDPKRVSQTMKRHQLSTDAGRYFQHRVNPIFASEVIRIAGTAIAHLGQGHIPSQPVDSFPGQEKSKPQKITLSLGLLHKTLGLTFAQNELDEIFTRLSFSFRWEEGKVLVEVPDYRMDLQEEWDLIEEVARVYGYNRIPITYPRITNAMGPLMVSPERKKDSLQEDLRSLCLAMGFQEILTYPFIENSFADKLRMGEENYLKPLNPVRPDVSFLRNSLLFGFLKTIQHNTEKQVSGFNKIFEMGKVFTPLSKTSTDPGEIHKEVIGKKGVDASPYEHNRLGLAVWGGDPLLHWQYPALPPDYSQISGAIEKIFQDLLKNHQDLYFYPGAGSAELGSKLKHALIPASQVRVIYHNHEVGVIGEVADSLKNYFELESEWVKKKIFYGELDLDLFLQPIPNVIFRPFSVYPAIRRDLALVIDEENSEQNVQSILKELPQHSSLLTQVNVTDVYTGENIPTGKKSVVFNLEFTAMDKTLKRSQADEEVTRLVNILKKSYTFTLR